MSYIDLIMNGIEVPAIYVGTKPSASGLPDGSLYLSEAPIVGLGTADRGPTGQVVPPNTPPYASAATRTASTTAELYTAIAAAAATSVREVIEVTGDLTGQVLPPYDTNSALRSENILVRPPLGDRGRVTYCKIRTEKLSFAGFDHVLGLNGAVIDTTNQQAMQIQASNSYFWRCVETGIRPFTWHVTDQDHRVLDGGFVECAWPHWAMNATWDRINYTAACNNALFHSNFIAPHIVGVLRKVTHPSWNFGTVINPGNPIELNAGEFDFGSDIEGGTEIVLPSPVENVTFPDTMGQAVLAYCDSDQADPATLTIKVNGTPWQTMTIGQSYQFGVGTTIHVDKRHALHRLGLTGAQSLRAQWLQGDVISVAVDKDVTGLHILNGVDCGAGPGLAGPDVHGDIFQIYGQGAKILYGGKFINNVIGGSSSNKAFQFNTPQAGEYHLENNFIGRISQGWAWGSFSYDVMREYLYRNVFQGSASVTFGGSMSVYENNEAASFSAFSGTPSVTNVERGTNLKFPLCPPLDAIWPECPKPGPYR